MNNFSIILDKKINKYIKLNNLTYMSFRKNGLGDISRSVRRGSTKTITLFKISKFLDIDVRQDRSENPYRATRKYVGKEGLKKKKEKERRHSVIR